MNDESKEECFVNEILCEYRGLEESLRSLGRLALKRRLPDADEIATDLVEEHLRPVRKRMERLFEYEERGGLYEDLLRLLPVENLRIEALKEEHPILLARINALIAMIGENEVADLEILRREIRSFDHALESPEHRENSCLQRPYYSAEGVVG